MKRTKKAIWHRASKLDIAYTFDCWTEEEDEIIRKYYPQYGEDECSKHLSNRTPKACKGRAQILGVKKESLWSEEEDNTLRHFYPIEGGDVYKRFYNKTKHQCMQHARLLELSAVTIGTSAQKWTPEEDEIIRKYYPTEGKRCCSRLNNRSEKVVRGRASFLGVKNIVSKTCPKRILCIETKEEFENITQAANKYGVSSSGFSKYVNKQRDYWGKLPDGTKLHWKYVEEDED